MCVLLICKCVFMCVFVCVLCVCVVCICVCICVLVCVLVFVTSMCVLNHQLNDCSILISKHFKDAHILCLNKYHFI